MGSSFTIIRECMEHLIMKGPIMWSLAIHTDALPGVNYCKKEYERMLRKLYFFVFFYKVD